MGKPYGSFYIPNEELNTFFELYDNMLLNGEKKLHLIEKHKEYSPMVIDIDEKYPLDTIARQHTKEHCKNWLL